MSIRIRNRVNYKPPRERTCGNCGRWSPLNQYCQKLKAYLSPNETACVYHEPVRRSTK